jgi:superfamily I DNA and RNA helicase
LRVAGNGAIGLSGKVIVTGFPARGSNRVTVIRTSTRDNSPRRALDAPWDKWAVFLHPAQLSLVQRSFSGPARVSGSAGTGKTIVALHRAVHLARANPEARVLLTTFSKGLANALRMRLVTLAGNELALASRRA